MSDDLPAPVATWHLGDGLYVSFDGYQIILGADREHPTDIGAVLRHWVALEPHVYRALRKWIAHYPRLARHMEGGRDAGRVE